MTASCHVLSSIGMVWIQTCRCIQWTMLNHGGTFVLQVFHLYVVLGVQDLLRLRIHVARVSDSDCRHSLRHYRVHLLLAECRRLSMVCVVTTLRSRYHQFAVYRAVQTTNY